MTLRAAELGEEIVLVDGELIGPWSASIEPLACISLWRNVKDKGMKMLIVVVVSLVFFSSSFSSFSCCLGKQQSWKRRRRRSKKKEENRQTR